MVDPLVAHDIVNGRSLRRFVVQNLRDQVASAVGDSHVLREVVGVHSDSLVLSAEGGGWSRSALCLTRA